MRLAFGPPAYESGQPRSNAGETGGIIASSDLAGRETHLVSLFQVEHLLESVALGNSLLGPAISVSGTHAGNILLRLQAYWSGAGRCLLEQLNALQTDGVIHDGPQPRRDLPAWKTKLLGLERRTRLYLS